MSVEHYVTVLTELQWCIRILGASKKLVRELGEEDAFRHIDEAVRNLVLARRDLIKKVKKY